MDDQHDRVRRGYEAIAEEYHAARTGGVVGNDLFERFSDRLVDGARVFDAGCGAGDPVMSTLVDRGFEPIGLDIAVEQIRLARGHVPEGLFVQGDLTALPFEGNQFDAAIALYSIIHVPRERHPTVYHELNRVLDDGGLLLVSVGIKAWKGRNPDWLDTGEEMLWSFPSLADSIDLIQEAEFDILGQTTVDDSLGSEYAFVLAQAETK